MAYPSLPSARRRHYEIDGAALGYNINGGFGTGMSTVLSGAQMLALNEETPSVDSSVVPVANSSDLYFFVLFAELTDITRFMTRVIWSSSGGPTVTISNIQGSTDTTNGADGTWSAMSNSGNTMKNYDTTGGGDWWRATSPGTISSNNTGLRGVRFQIHFGGANNASLRNLYLWGTKHSGETPDDVIFLESDAATEWPNDDDWGDVGAGTSAVTHTYYLKNTSATKTANTITVKASGSDSGKWTVSLDNSSFASSQSISSIAAGATQVVYFKFTPPSPAAGVYRPYAAYLEADVTSWT